MVDVSHIDKESIPEVRSRNEFTLDWPEWDSDKSDSEKRKEIKTKLDNYNFGINTAPVSTQRLKEVGADGQDADGHAIMDGIAWVRAFYDGTNKTGKIKQGHPVVFDTVTGRSVTGINEEWGVDEYKVVGTALQDYEDTDPKGSVVPIKLSATGSPSETQVFLARVDRFRIPGRRTDSTGEESLRWGYAFPAELVSETSPFPRTIIKQEESTSGRWQIYNASTRDIQGGSLVAGIIVKGKRLALYEIPE